ncbi:MAG: 16S rRNA processing protein RimM [Bacteroidetes bacterium]|nr:MAG: 16S rRNA processing protein RimM [Bacteroidota bacterium]
MEGYFYLGKILKLHAAKGALLIHLDTDSPENYTELESVFVQMNGQLIPFFIESLEHRHNNNAVVTFADIDSTDQASLLISCALFLPLTMLPPLTGTRFYYHEVKGFSVMDENFGEAGIIEEVLEYPHQAVLRVLFKGKEILIPITDEIILEVNRETRTIHTRAPEGLIELYLE